MVASTTQADSVDAGSGFVSSSCTTPSLSNDRSPIESRYASEAAVAAEDPSLSDCFVGVLDMVLNWLCKSCCGGVGVKATKGREVGAPRLRLGERVRWK